MTTATQNLSFFPSKKTQKMPLTLGRVIAALLMVDLRDSLDAKIKDDKSDAFFTYGL
ncbi:MAG: hypothetical protein ACJ8G3_25675 [Burkholderiaceae bacterium]